MRGEHEQESSDACVFCARRGQPALLFETDTFYVMPDKFPLVPGHVLIIPKEHVRCYGAMSIDALRALDEAAMRIRRFLSDMYGAPVLTTETGVLGQTVFHAHLHLIPLPHVAFPPEVFRHGDVTPIADWRAVQGYYAEHGHYYYVEVGGKRYVITSYQSPVIHAMRRAVAGPLGLSVGERGFVRATTPDDVLVMGQRWRDWTQQGI